MHSAKTAIVLGGYGFIGSACLRSLKRAGFRTIGVGRSIALGRQCDPDIEWIETDIANTSADEWSRHLKDADVVVNASGALQDGLRDNLNGIHVDAMENIVAALTGTTVRVVQISAAGASEDAGTSFMRSKARGDKLLEASDVDCVILRPVLVIGPQAYGGTALLRATAALPLVRPRLFVGSTIQTVSVLDVAQAVVHAATGRVSSGTVSDLTETEQRTFPELLEVIRRWQGFHPAKVEVDVPQWVVSALGRVADCLGWLGWRSPLRSTALRNLEVGIKGDPTVWLAAGGERLGSLAETLAAIPATTQERWFARLYMLLPTSIVILSVFWIVSGLVGLLEFDAARSLLTERGITPTMAKSAVFGGAIFDLVLGTAILFRKTVRLATGGMIILSASYLVAAAVWTPDLWVDPLGPLVKVLPGMLLAAIVAALVEDR
jgi:uncharacterized protein YbjT (DUF2867 family)